MASSSDPFSSLKAQHREMWATFSPTAAYTTPVAAHLVDFAGVEAGESVLDVGTGTGVVAITAARRGADVTGLDLTPALLDVARQNSRVAALDAVQWIEGDAEALPFPDGRFDVVLSQFGHMFAPRAAIAMAEMRRVLRPGGRVAFATWPPEHFIGRLFSFVAGNSPPPPPGVSPPPQWGVPSIVAERLGDGIDAPFFSRGIMRIPALSLSHFRELMERTVGPVQKLVESAAGDPQRLQRLRQEFEALAHPYFSGNMVRQEYLLTRARAQ